MRRRDVFVFSRINKVVLFPLAALLVVGVFGLTVAKKPAVAAKSCCPAHDKAGVAHDGKSCPMMKTGDVETPSKEFPAPARVAPRLDETTLKSGKKAQCPFLSSRDGMISSNSKTQKLN